METTAFRGAGEEDLLPTGTFRAHRTEPGEVQLAGDAPDVLAGAGRAWGRRERRREGGDEASVSAGGHAPRKIGAGIRRRGRTELAESTVVVWALDLALLRVGVEALVARGAVPVLGVPPALGHSPKVVLV